MQWQWKRCRRAQSLTTPASAGASASAGPLLASRLPYSMVVAIERERLPQENALPLRAAMNDSFSDRPLVDVYPSKKFAQP